MESREDSSYDSCGHDTSSCIKTFNHIKEHRKESQCDSNISNLYKCKSWDFETNLKVSLTHHINQTHKNTKNQHQIINIRRQCGFCDFQTYSILLLLKHNLNCDHRKNILTDDTSLMLSHISWLECGYCPYKTKYDTTLRTHIRVKHANLEIINWFKCDKCSFKTKVEIYLRNHMNIHNDDSRKIKWHHCVRCEFKTKWKKLLYDHLAIHRVEPTNRVWYHCDKCEYKSQLKADLPKHILNSHTDLANVEWHHCNKCQFKAQSKSSLKKHIKNTHTDLTDIIWYHCNRCEYKSQKLAYLDKHITNAHQIISVRDIVKDIVRNNGDIVSFLLEDSRSSKLTYEDRLFLKQMDRPTPPLKNLINLNPNSSNRRFAPTWYQKCKWLTGSEDKNKLYCWQCLLFNPPGSMKSPWHTTGFDNMKSLSRSVERHEVSKDHIYSSLKFKLLGSNKQNSLDSTRRGSVNKHNEKVKENRDILKRLIDMTIHLATQQVEDDAQNYEKILELAEFLSNYDSKFEEFLKSSSVFSEMSKTIQDDLIDSLNHVVLESIESEILNSVCFSWEIDTTCHSQLSVIFRFTHEGEVVERFLGLFDVSAGQSADGLFNFLSLQFEKFNLKDKLIGQVYDGASVMSGDLIELQSRIKTKAPQAFLMYCNSHRLNLILQDSVTSIRECKLFFATLSGISAFFKFPKRTKVLENVCKRRAPSINAQINLNFKSGIVHTVLTHREELLEAFEEIIESNDFARDSTSIRESTDYIYFLNNFDNLFVLNVFSKIFQQTHIIDAIIQSQSEIVYNKYRVDKILGTIKSFREGERPFRDLYDNTVKVLGIPPKRRQSINLPDHDYDDVILHSKRLYSDILDLIIAQIQDRLVDFDMLLIFDLLNNYKFALFEKYFPSDILNLLLKNYSKLFNKERLESELKILYSNVTILGESGGLKDKLKFIIANSLQDIVPEIFKLLSLLLSLPVTSASGESSVSAFKRVKNYARDTMSQSRLRKLSLIAVEKEMIKSLRKAPDFFDRVIDHFARGKDRGIDLVYKNL